MGEMKTIHETARSTPVLAECDVLVAGGGVAGCAAAWAAATAGARTILVERNGCLGGVATATGMSNIANLMITADDRLVVRGFARNLIDRLIETGAASSGWASRDIPGCCMDSERMKVVLIEMLQEAGVEILTHAMGTRPVVDGARVGGAFIESKSGREAILAGATVDATGEADLVARTGAQAEMHQGSASILFKFAGVDIDRFVECCLADPDGFPAPRDFTWDLDTFVRNWRERGVLFFPHGGGNTWPFMRRIVEAGRFEEHWDGARSLAAFGLYGIRGNGFVTVNANFETITGLDVRDLSKLELLAQRACYHTAAMMQREIPGFENAVVASVGTDLGVRQSRRIVGRETLARDAVYDPQSPSRADAVIGTMAAWLSKPAEGQFVSPYTVDVPFGISVPRGCENLLVASAKSVSTDPIALIRTMPGCMICGQATGVAAAIAVRDGVNAEDAPIREVQRTLLRQDAHLGPDERLSGLGLA
jgi:hypothetical protein